MLLFFALLIGGIARTPTDFYVSASGSDSNPGTAAAPFQTLAYAQTVVRGYTAVQNRSTTVHIVGTLPVTSTLALTSSDSGRNGYTVTWSGGTLTGGSAVTGWALWDVGKNIYRTSYSGTNPRTIWTDGVRAYRSRVPVDSGFAATAAYTSTGFSSTAGFLNGTRNVANVELIFNAPIGNILQFTQPRNKVTAATSTTVTMQTDCHVWIHSFMGGAYITPTDVENLYENFYANATQGTFYFDQAASFLYYVPRPGEGNLSTVSVIAPATLEKFITVTGASNIDISGLTIEHNNYSMPYGFAENAQNQIRTSTNADPFVGAEFPPAALTIIDCVSVRVLTSTFRHLSTMGVHVDGTSASCTVDHCTITDTAANGAAVGHNDQGPGTTCVDALAFTSNTITYVGQEFQGASGISATFLKNSFISNNAVSQIPYAPISYGLGLDLEPTWPLKNINNTISANRLDNGCLVRIDGGAIYLQGPQSNLVVTGNYGTNCGSLGGYTAGLYLDAGVTNLSITNNVFAGGNYLFFIPELNEPVTGMSMATNYGDLSTPLFQFFGGTPAGYVAPTQASNPLTIPAAAAIAAAAGPL